MLLYIHLTFDWIWHFCESPQFETVLRYPLKL